MRLLERKPNGELAISMFSGNKVPKYAILSHTWATDSSTEVSFQDLQANTGKRKAGFDKMKFCSEQAAADRLRYFWIDTCCIDKSSSAELEEAINSMFEWYRKSSICYVYLSDVADQSQQETNLSLARWFTRGWTLQELIAPHTVRFYSRGWHFIGTKEGLADTLTRITSIPSGVLTGTTSLNSKSVAQRMSWASERRTTRSEDIAYSLMGIFSVNMPMLYGEGERAFRRLQDEIIKASDDHSIFAWRYPDSGTPESMVCGLLAEHPRYFSDSPAEVPAWMEGGMSTSRPFSITNKGIQIEAILVELNPQQEVYAMILNCRPNRASAPSLGDGALAIVLDGRNSMRVNPSQFMFIRHLSSSIRIIWVEPMGKRPDYDDEYLPRKPKSRVYTLATREAIQPRDDAQKLLQKFYPDGMLLPMFLSDASTSASGRVRIGWTASWNIAMMKFDEFRCLYLESDEGQRLTIQLGVKREIFDEGFGPEYYFRGYFYAMETWDSKTEFWPLAKTARDTQVLAYHRVHVLCEDVYRPSQRKGEERIELTFVIRIQAYSGKDHHFVSCDNCMRWIHDGTRYKCKNCEDFDYCDTCIVLHQLLISATPSME